MQCFLKDAAEKQVNDNRILQWISEIKELAQDTEDVVDTFILKVENPKENDSHLKRFVTFPKHVYHLEKVGKEIESIRARLKDIDESRERFGIQNLGDGTSSSSMISDNVGIMHRQLSPWQKDKHVVGLEDDVEMLLKRAVMEESVGLFVATIAGMGGLGKSTLAKAVYNHAVVGAGFDCRAWVCVSNDFKPKEIIKELVLQLVVEPGQKSQVLEIMEKAPLEHIKSMLYQRLQGTRYFIVLDDVWHEDAWESLASAFPDEQDKASRLLLTSRNQDIPRCARYVHNLKTLDWVKSWQLFLKKAFIDGKCPENLEETGKEILRKCYGLPLAITVVGGLLLRESRSGWEKVLKGMNSYMGSSKTSSVSAILELSYHDLPPQLKLCFLCLGLFKEDATIRASKLVQVWIAEGFIRREGGGGETMEEIARSYLDELIHRNMVQVKDTSSNNRVKICHIHDLLRDLSIRKAKEEIGFEILREGDSESSNKSRHRAIYSRRRTSFTYSGSSSNSHIRSLFFHEGCDVDGYPNYWKSFELLRVLDMEDCGLIIFPDTICKLIGLRYLGLRRNHLETLPSSLYHLKNLQVLDVRENYILKVPNVVWKMDSLRHLYMFLGKMPLKIGALKNLRTLAFILVDSQVLKHLTQMASLRKLRIYVENNTDVSKLCNSLAMLENLSSLYLGFHVNRGTESFVSLEIYNGQSFESLHSLHHLTLSGCMTKFPTTTRFPPNLSHLTLSGNYLDEDPMPVLEKLPKLLYLKLHSAYDGIEMVISHDGFPRLEVLSLVHLKKLSNIEFGKGALQKLERLEINRCRSLWKIISLDRLPEELRLKIVTSDQHLHLQLSNHTYINV